MNGNQSSRNIHWLLNLMGMAITVLILFGLWKLCVHLMTTFSSLEKDVAIPLVTVAGTVFVSFLSIAYGKYLERRLVIEQENRKMKAPVYEHFMDFFTRLLMNSNGQKKVMEEETQDFIKSFTKKIVVWGSDEFVKIYSEFRLKLVKNAEQVEGQQKLSPQEMLRFWETSMRAIRKDIGHKNRGFGKWTLANMYINDLPD